MTSSLSPKRSKNFQGASRQGASRPIFSQVECGTLVIEQNGIKRIDPETVDAKRICGYKLDELVIVLQAYSVILQGFGVLMNGLDAFQDAAIRWFDGVKDECSYNPQANLDCVLRGFTITIPFDDFLFGSGGFSSIMNLLPGVDIGGS